MGMVLKTRKLNAFTKTALALAVSALSSHALGWDTPVNLHESDDMLLWDANAPSYNFNEDGAYISTVHDATSFGPIFNNSVYQVVAHDHGMEYSALSIGYLFMDDDKG